MGEISFTKIIRYLLARLYTFIIGFILLLILSTYLYLKKDEIYEIRSNLQIYPPAQSSIGQEIQLDLLTSNNSPTLSDLVLLYKTRTNMLSIIEKFNLNIEVEDDLFDKFIFNKLDINISSDDMSKVFFLSFDEDKYSLHNTEKKLIGTSKYNDDFKNLNYHLNIARPLNYDKDRLYKVIYLNDELLIKHLKRVINVEIQSATNLYTQPKSGLLEASIKHNNIDEGIQMLDYANEIFISKGVFEQSERARLSILFLDKTIKNLQDKLKLEKEELNAYQRETRTLNVEIEIQTIINQLAELNSQINEIDLKISDNKKVYTEINPFYDSLIKQREILDQKRNEIERIISNLPTSQQVYIDLYRRVEMSEILVTELLNRRLEFQILEASTLGNVAVSDQSYFSHKVDPKITMIPVIVFIGMILLSVFVTLRGIFFSKLNNPAELNENGRDVEVIGVFKKTDIDLLHPNDDIEKATESLLTNIFYIAEEKNKDSKDSKVILISSPTASNGKSTHSLLSSKKLAQLGHKTLLIDFDLVRGELHKELNVKKLSKNKFYNLSNDIENFKLDNNFYFIPKINAISSPFEFFNSPTLKSIIAKFKDEFDYIIIDSAPVLSVPETSTLIGFSDINILVVRHEYNSLNEYEYAKLLYEQVGSSLDGIIYNMITHKNRLSYYGYGGIDYQYYAHRYTYNKYSYKE